MAPNSWATAEETAFLQSLMAAYITHQAEGKLWRFWPMLHEKWFRLFPEETRQGFPAPTLDGDGPELSPEAEGIVAEGLVLTKGRLENWYRYHSRKVTQAAAARRNGEDSLDNDLFRKKPLRQRLHRPTELFQKRNHGLIDNALKDSGFFDLNEAQMSLLVVDWANETDAEHAARIKAAQAERMRIRTRVVNELFAEASADELRSIDELIAEEHKKFQAIRKGTKKGRKAQEEHEAEDAARDPTPEEYQLAIDESPEVLARVHKALAKRTGWYGITIYGGPNPRFGGGLSMKTVCFGRTIAGNDFEAAHGTFDEAISKKFQAFLKRSFPASVRRERALQEVEEDATAPLPSLDGLFRLPNEAEAPAPAAREKPKRVRKPKAKKKPSAVSAVNTSALPTTTLSASAALSPTSVSPASSTAVETSTASPFSVTTGSDSLFNNDLDLREGEDLGDLFGLEGEGGAPAQVDSQWPAGMGPPSSPASAEAAANAERGGLHGATYMHATVPSSPPIDPLLLDTASRLATPTVSSPVLHGVAWNSMPASPTPTRPTRSSLGFNFPVLSTPVPVPSAIPPASRLDRLLKTYHHIMGDPAPPGSAAVLPQSTANAGVATTEVSRPVLCPLPRPLPRPLAVASTISSNSPARISRISSTVAGGTQPVHHGEDVSVTEGEGASGAFLMRTRPMTKDPNAPKGKAKTSASAPGQEEGKKSGAKTRGKKVASGGVKTTAAKEAAAKEAAKVARKKSTAATGTGSASASAHAGAEVLVDAMNAESSSGAPAEPPTLIFTVTNNGAANARMARRMEVEKKARDEAERKERTRLNNPDGPHDLVILPGPGRAQRSRKAPRNHDGSEVSVPKKITRAQQLAKQNAASENALLARTGTKRGAAEAMPAASRATKKSKK